MAARLLLCSGISISTIRVMAEASDRLQMMIAEVAELLAEPESLPRRFLLYFRQVGPLYTVQNVIKSVFPERILQAGTAYIFEADLRAWPRDGPIDSDVRWAEETDSRLMRQSGMSDESFHAYLAAGAHIAILRRDDDLHGYFMYESGDIEFYPWLRYRLEPDIAWTSMTWTAPRHRGEGVHGRIQQFALAGLSHMGYVRKIASVGAANIPSLRASIKKSVIAGTVSFVRSPVLTAVWVNGRMSVGRWNDGNPLSLGSDLFHIVPGRPYGIVDEGHFEQITRRQP